MEEQTQSEAPMHTVACVALRARFPGKGWVWFSSPPCSGRMDTQVGTWAVVLAWQAQPQRSLWAA